MNPKNRLYAGFAGMLPKAYRKHMELLQIYAGLKTDSMLMLGSTNLLAFLAAIIMLIIPFTILPPFSYLFILYSALAYLAVHFFFYLIAYFMAESRTKRVEEALPDALQLISANLKAGMTPFQALKASSRKEFGPLKDEIDLATRTAFGTQDFSKSLMLISSRVRSETLERALKLFTTSMKSGGHMAGMLEELSNDIAETKSLKRELVTSTKSYSMFIMFTVIIGTPLLLAIASQFLKIITNISANAQAKSAGFGMGFLTGEIAITVDFMTSVSIWLLLITGLLASVLIGVIREGKGKYGLKYAPLVIGGSFIVFYIAKSIVSGLF